MTKLSRCPSRQPSPNSYSGVTENYIKTVSDSNGWKCKRGTNGGLGRAGRAK